MTTSRIQKLSNTYMEYDIISLHTNLPEYPLHRIHLLEAFLRASAVKQDERELFAVVTSLVQMGMDTHDQVPETNQNKDKKSVRSRQLKVLAGDFFSARFYQLLAQAGQVDMIKQLSAGVCEVNRLKMTFYMKMKQWKMTAEDYLKQVSAIKAELLMVFHRRMDGMLQHVWPELLQTFTYCEALREEIQRMENKKFSKSSWMFWKLLQGDVLTEEREELLAEAVEPGRFAQLATKYQLIHLLYKQLEEQLSIWRAKTSELASEPLKQQLQCIIEPFVEMLAKPKVLEEI